MRTLLSSIILFLLSCSNNNSPTNFKDISTNKIAYITSKTEEVNINLNENSNYIGFINSFYFSNNNEVYIELYFVQDEFNEDYQDIANLADSIIYKDDENTRKRFPLVLSQKYFYLRGLGKLKIYDTKNNFVGKADFVRVEYLDQNISPCFIAVYKTEKHLKEGAYYCISNFKEDLAPQRFTLTGDTVLTERILTELNISRPYYGLKNNGTHVLYNTRDTMLSIVNSDNYAYIILSHDKTHQILYKSTEFENFSGVIVLPIFKNKMPYILAQCVRPESDVMWENLFSFEETNYKPTNRQRMK
jgi:hypothetical protein